MLIETDPPLDAAQPTLAEATRRPAWSQIEGSPLPLGVTWIEREQAFNFAVHSEHAESVTLLLYSATDVVNPLVAFRFDFLRNKSGRTWHCRMPISEIGDACYYAYSVSGPTGPALFSFDPQEVLLDPYAKCIFFPPDFDRELAAREGANAGKAPLARWRLTARHLTGKETTHRITNPMRSDLRGPREGIPQLRHPNSGVDPRRAGTYAGWWRRSRIRKTRCHSVELMPVFQRDPQEGDYWGYMPLNFFAPHAQYACTATDDEQHLEFRNMVKAFHQAGIGVVLDVVYNHTCRGRPQGPIYSYKGLDGPSYYMLSSDPANPYANYLGHRQYLEFWPESRAQDGDGQPALLEGGNAH